LFAVIVLAGCEAEMSPSFQIETTEPDIPALDDSGTSGDGASILDGAGNGGGTDAGTLELPGMDALDAAAEPDLPAPCLSDADCDDANLCTLDSCDPLVGCTSVEVPDACDDGVDCTVDSCAPQTGCNHLPDGNLCNDGVACTADICDPGGCLHTVDGTLCDDGNPCTQEWCDPLAGCKSQFQEAACNDGDPCTGPDWCQSGVCTGSFVQSQGCLYAQAPNIPGCSAGALTMAARMAALARVNQIRAMVGIPALTYDTTHDNQVQQAALVMAANASLSHTPPNNWWCWTQAAYDGASSSNLHLGMNTDGKASPPAEVVDALAVDMNVESLGHRRWILDPFLTRTSYGFVSGTPKVNVGWPYVYSGVLRVIDDLYANLSGLAIDYVAYPYGNFPASLLPNGWYLSFSVLMDKTNLWNNASVNYSGVTVKVAGPGGSNMPVSSVKWANDGMGLPNHLQWKCPGLKVGTQYSVTIGNVAFKGSAHQFQYTFVLQ
jgi:uncharacterized protein YkwD